MNQLSLIEINEKVNKFVKHVFDTYNNPQKMCKLLNFEFERKGLMCGFTWIPSDEYYGDIKVIFIATTDLYDRKNQIIRSNKSRDLLSKKMDLSEFIYNVFNPEGLLILEKIQFDLEG